MRLITIVAATGAIFGVNINGLACKDGVKYCSYSLKSGGHYWTEDEIWSQLQWEGLPEWYTKNHIEHTLFKCEDHWYWSKAHLYYVDWCANRCQDGGSGNDDSCRPPSSN
ncbi:hypothetical protein ONS95_005196 [Cadophora gregata]|uniref:uncharacterized protein n=1 Tax=Cadophora gregata TaxID=51156 RepID=UPI0026DB72E4|nr:uncharacterized protein ONS95_005196 [Cadophora gregata]KAK0104935.1 hypothetical protein ONS95_005196 [Cadophora gregata]KAK0114985.1 hypothetical protein ONS96_013459 [Cadophora gregata f. sp. sojae]